MLALVMFCRTAPDLSSSAPNREKVVALSPPLRFAPLRGEHLGFYLILRSASPNLRLAKHPAETAKLLPETSGAVGKLTEISCSSVFSQPWEI